MQNARLSSQQNRHTASKKACEEQYLTPGVHQMHGCDKLTNTYAFRGGTGKLCACQFCTNRRKNVFFSQLGASYNTPRSYASGYLVALLVDGHLLYHHDAVSACPRQQQGHLPVHQCPQGLESDIRGTQGGRDCLVSARTLRTEHPRNDKVKTNLQRTHLQDQKTVSSTISWSCEECGKCKLIKDINTTHVAIIVFYSQWL